MLPGHLRRKIRGMRHTWVGWWWRSVPLTIPAYRRNVCGRGVFDAGTDSGVISALPTAYIYYHTFEGVSTGFEKIFSASPMGLPLYHSQAARGALSQSHQGPLDGT